MSGGNERQIRVADRGSVLVGCVWVYRGPHRRGTRLISSGWWDFYSKPRGLSFDATRQRTITVAKRPRLGAGPATRRCPRSKSACAIWRRSSSALPKGSMSLLRSLPADDLIGAQMVGRPLPSWGHREGPPVCQRITVGDDRLYRLCIKCLANFRLTRNPVKGPSRCG